MYIHEHQNWSNFRWDGDKIAVQLDEVARQQGLLYGKLSGLGFDNQLKVMAENLTRDLVHSSEIEGITLNTEEVRSSIARRLGLENTKSVPSSHYVDGVVSVMLEVTEHYDQPLTKEKLCGWQAAFFPTGYSGGSKIEVGQYRTHKEHIVSSFWGRERIHYVAPAPDRVEKEMGDFLSWFNTEKQISPIIRSAIAHFWFVSIHPFEDGNGRLARIIGDIFLARGDRSKFRFYNISSRINRDKKHYYEILERMQHGSGDITEWLCWYLKTLLAAIREANSAINTILNKSLFWMRASNIPMTERQIGVLNLFLDGYEAKITSKTWADLGRCSKDTANRDIQDLVSKGILREDIPGAKRPSYSLIFDNDTEDFARLFTEVKIIEEDEAYFLTAIYNGMTPVKERLLRLDAERVEKGDLSMENLLAKYCTYILKR